MTFLLITVLGDLCFDSTRLRVVANEGQNMTKLVKLISKLHAIVVWVKHRNREVRQMWEPWADYEQVLELEFIGTLI